jgi:nucleotide-binding universal stress UspA family protein
MAFLVVICGPSMLGSADVGGFSTEVGGRWYRRSQAALRAALWAVDEVASTDIPLRLLYIRDLSPTAGGGETQAATATAEEAVYDAYNAINAVGKPVKVEMDIVEGHPVPALIQASESTALLCVGDTGSGQTSPPGSVLLQLPWSILHTARWRSSEATRTRSQRRIAGS